MSHFCDVCASAFVCHPCDAWRDPSSHPADVYVSSHEINDGGGSFGAFSYYGPAKKRKMKSVCGVSSSFYRLMKTLRTMSLSCCVVCAYLVCHCHLTNVSDAFIRDVCRFQSLFYYDSMDHHYHEC